MAVPSAPTDEIYPGYTDLVDNWRAVDAHWIRDRLVQVFDDNAERASVITSPRQGMMSYLKGTDSLEFRKAAAWESVRYPNLDVTSDASSITLRRTGAGSGISLLSDGSVNIAKAFIGSGGVGSTLDNTGVAIKVGTKTVKLSTDTTQLTIDSPVSVTGNITTSATLTAAALSASTLNLSGTLTGAAITATTVTGSGIVKGASLEDGGSSRVITESSLGKFRNKTASSWLGIADSGATELRSATTLDLYGSAINIRNPTVHFSTTSFQGQPTLDFAGMTSTKVAGIVVSTSAASGNYPDGTLWVQV